MQSAEVVLSMLAQKSAQNSEFVFDRLYRNLFNPDFYMLAYNNLYAREGNMTEGVDENIIDGFNTSSVNKLIEKLRNETYSPKPIRRTSIPQKDGVHGIPSFQDKLVQEVVRLLLQAIYEPVFKDSSHGFRPGKSCHTALTQIKTTCKGTNWVIEGDIKGFFDTISYGKLREILSRRISDGRFLNLIGKFLTAGYMEFNQVHTSLTGTLQGEIISPILANIYLHDLDAFMEQICEQYSTQKRVRRANPDYQRWNWQRFVTRENGDEEMADGFLQMMRNLPRGVPTDSEYIRVNYIRYADNFLVMIIGSKELANHIREKIRIFLQQGLQLELNMEKTRITHLSDQNVRFLGYEIARTRENAAITENTLGVKKRAANETIQLLVPSDIIRKNLAPFVEHGKSVHHNARINLPLLDLLTQYNAEIRGLYNYYCLATDVSTKIGKFRYYHYYSLLKTVAQKEKCSIAQVLDKYGVDVKLKQKAGTRKIFGVKYQTKEGTKTMIYFNDPIKKKGTPQEGKIANGILETVIPQRHHILDRINAKECELCGKKSANADDFEVHHVRKLRDIKRKYARWGNHIPTWVLAISSLNRKTLVICKACHDTIQAGTHAHSIKEAVKIQYEELGTAGEPDTLKGVRPVRRGVQ